jgi:hypothetical protein
VIEERQLGIVEGGALTTVELPGWPVEDGSAESPTFFPLGSGFLALQIHSDHTVRTWRSYDGRSWAEGERLRGPDGQLLEGRWISWAGSPERSDIQIGTLGEPTAGGPAAYWRSTDAEHWTLVSPPSWEGGIVWEVPGGFLRLRETGSWSASTDGDSWIEAPALREVVDRWQPDGGGGTTGTLVGDAFFFWVDEAEGPMRRDLWIIEFEPRPS